MKKSTLGVLLIAALFLVVACSPQEAESIIVVEEGEEEVMDDSEGEVTEDKGGEAAVSDDEDGDVMEDQETKTFVLTGQNFKFSMNGAEAPELVVKEGDTVRIEFSSTSGLHDWVVDEFSARTQRVNTGGLTFVEFVADKKGTFEYYCSVGSHRAFGMKGNLIVE